MIQKPTRLAIAGRKGSGKNFAGAILQEEYNLHQRAFADVVRNTIKKTFQLQSDEEYETLKRSTHKILNREIHGRDLVLGIGMSLRALDDEHPQKYILNQPKEVLDNLVITDLRFQNELEFCKKYNFITIKIKDTEELDRFDVHESEIGFKDEDVDIVVENDKTNNFKEVLLKALQEFMDS